MMNPYTNITQALGGMPTTREEAMQRAQTMAGDMGQNGAAGGWGILSDAFRGGMAGEMSRRWGGQRHERQPMFGGLMGLINKFRPQQAGIMAPQGSFNPGNIY